MSLAGQNLKYLRKLRGWTQEEFATKLGIKRSLIGAYEEERADPRLDVFQRARRCVPIGHEGRVQPFFPRLTEYRACPLRRHQRLVVTADDDARARVDCLAHKLLGRGLHKR